MDASEAIAEKLLRNMGFTSVVYEPDGNVPPDFLADGQVAIEVRRLNQNHDSGNGKRGLEETSIPLWQRIQRLGDSFGSATTESWFLIFRFSRRVKPWKELGAKLRTALATFISQPARSSGRLYTDDNFELDVIRATQPLDRIFVMGGRSDFESGGFIVDEILTNISHCATEKLQKIADFRSGYPEWWLVLVDHIGFGLDSSDKQQLLAQVKRPDGWDQIVLVSPGDPSNWLEF